ncbi:hypothetical protein [Halomonas sp. HG01]|uniref:hypothetical protein n=1 Tax=Halomonas sp. HG01 TaxID=1609967 RepID=UPI0006146C61|nr:hypothetical protein [Halomonas sp. HG01]
MEITVGELKRMLEIHNDDDVLSFCGLDFYRLKRRGPKLVQVEFDQQVTTDDEGRVIIDD